MSSNFYDTSSHIKDKFQSKLGKVLKLFNISAYFSLLQPTPANTSLYQHIPAFSNTVIYYRDFIVKSGTCLNSPSLITPSSKGVAKKQEAQLDTMVHSSQNTYQWLLSWVEEPGEVATMTKCSPCHTTGTCKFKDIGAISMSQSVQHNCIWRDSIWSAWQFFQTADCLPKVGKSSCDVIYSLKYNFLIVREGRDINTNQEWMNSDIFSLNGFSVQRGSRGHPRGSLSVWVMICVLATCGYLYRFHRSYLTEI